jgi:hypothetical protein
MTRPHLAPCAACARHVRVSEDACPFCGVPLAASMRASSPPRGPAVRLTRAALFAFGALGASAVGAAAAAGCSSSSSTGTLTPPYGIGPFDGGDESDATYAPHYGLPGVDAAYGAPGIDFGDAGDAGDVAVVGQDAGYGSPGIDFDAAADGGKGAGNTPLDSGADSGHD